MDSFEAILGNQSLLKHLKKAVAERKISHAYLFTGAKGTGKRTIARAFAKALECEGEGEKPCLHCQSCRVFESGNHPDVFFIRPQKGKALGINEIREQVVEEINSKQYRYRYKIFLIEQANTMTIAAQNALLKTLEEPPSYGVFLLLTDKPKMLLSTILSRVVLLQTKGLSAELIKEQLTRKYAVPEAEASIFAAYAQGSLGSALQYKEEERFLAMRKAVLELVRNIGSWDLVEVLKSQETLSAYKEEPELLEIFTIWYRDLLAVKRLGSKEFLIEKDAYGEIKRLVQKESAESLLKKIEAVLEAKKQLQRNANFQLALEVMLMKLKESS